MNARFSVVAMAMLIFGIFFLVGFWPLSIVLFIVAAVIQSKHRARALEYRKARRLKDRDKREASMVAAARSFR